MAKNSLLGIVAVVGAGIIALIVLRPQLCTKTFPGSNFLCNTSKGISSVGGQRPLTGNVGTTGQQNTAIHHAQRRAAAPKKSVTANTVSRMANAVDIPGHAII